MGQESVREKEILDFVNAKRTFIGNEALQILAAREDWKEIIGACINENEFFIKPEHVEKKIVRTKIGLVEKEEPEQFAGHSSEKKCAGSETADADFH
ncbi:MAG: hypothetical protein V1493_03000, partial [Candidatus Diapherotrites archaeon]